MKIVVSKNNRPQAGYARPGFFFRTGFIGIFLCIISVTLLFSFASLQAATREVIDQTGRKISVSVDPKRVVSLSPSITENIFAIHQEHRLVGITRFSDYPPETESYPKVGSYTRLDLEKIVALKPDLCIGLKDGNPVETIQRLEALKIPVYVTDPRNIDEVLKTILDIGELLNSSEQAQHLVGELYKRIERVTAVASKIDRKPKVFFQIGISPIVSAGDNTFIHELITLASGTNLSAGPTPYPRFSREKVLGLGPEILIITSMARGGGFESMKAWWGQWPDMPAVQNSRIYLMDSNLLDRASPRMIDGLEILARHLHPTFFEDEP